MTKPLHLSARKGAAEGGSRKTLNIMNSGYGNYGASTSKKSTVGWLYGGGSAREDIEDNLDVLRQRSRDLYMGVPLATGAVKTMRTNVVGRGLKLKPTIDREALGLAAEAAHDLERAIEREWKLWAESRTVTLPGWIISMNYSSWPLRPGLCQVTAWRFCP